MADDIVARLRNACAHLCDKCERENAYGVGSDAADLIEAQQAEIERLRAEIRHKALDHTTTIGELMEAQMEIDRLREWKAVAEMFGAAFHVDEWGQYSPSDGSDVHQAVLAYERLKTKEARRG